MVFGSAGSAGRCRLTSNSSRDGEIPEFPGISAPYEAPLSPELTLHTDRDGEEECRSQLLQYLEKKGIETEHVLKVTEGRPHVVDKIVDGEVDLVINTTFGKKEIADSFSIRRESLMHSVPYFTTVQAARMAVGAIERLSRGRIPVWPMARTRRPSSAI